MALNGIRDMPISNPMHALLILVATEASSGWSDMSIEESSSSAISVGYVGMGKNYRKKWVPTEAKISWFGRWSGMKAFEGCRIDSLFQEGNVRPDSRDISTQRKTIAKIAAITNILIKGLYDKLCMMTKKKKRKGQSLDKNIYCPVQWVQKDPRWVSVRRKDKPTPSAISRQEIWTAPPYQFSKRPYATKKPDWSEKWAGLKEFNWPNSGTFNPLEGWSQNPHHTSTQYQHLYSRYYGEYRWNGLERTRILLLLIGRTVQKVLIGSIV